MALITMALVRDWSHATSFAKISIISWQIIQLGTYNWVIIENKRNAFPLLWRTFSFLSSKVFNTFFLFKQAIWSTAKCRSIHSTYTCTRITHVADLLLGEGRRLEMLKKGKQGKEKESRSNRIRGGSSCQSGC